MNPITLIATDHRRFDPLALDQLAKTAAYDGMARVVGLPDLHAGNGIAVGAAFWSPDRIWPHLVGSDIGCGMALWETDCPVRKFRLAAAERKLQGLDEPWSGDGAAALADAGVPPQLASAALGTIGGGNHFVEFLRIEQVADEDRFAALDLRHDRVWMMVHSGSRGLGQAVQQAHRQADISRGIIADTPEACAYLADHDAAMQWASVNRAIIATRFSGCLGINGRRVLDICHNSVTPHQGGWLHRKGAAPADRGLVTIPGSRGDFSYLVEPLSDHADHALHSLAHGAGRKWKRDRARLRTVRCGALLTCAGFSHHSAQRPCRRRFARQPHRPRRSRWSISASGSPIRFNADR
jgi:release factor H-coupled RctB family protein